MESETSYLKSEMNRAVEKLSRYEEEFDSLREKYVSISNMWMSPRSIGAYASSGILFTAFTIAFLLPSLLVAYEKSFELYKMPVESALSFGIAAGIIPLIVVASQYSLKLQRQNTELNVKYWQLRELRSKIISIREKLSRVEIPARIEIISGQFVLPHAIANNKFALSSLISSELGGLRRVITDMALPPNVMNFILEQVDNSVITMDRLIDTIRRKSEGDSIELVLLLIRKIEEFRQSFRQDRTILMKDMALLDSFSNILLQHLMILKNLLGSESSGSANLSQKTYP